MISALEISLARGFDALAIAQMSRQRIEDGLPWRWTPERVARNLARAHTNAIVGRIDGALAGFALMAYREQEAHLLLMAVSAPRARQGVGSRLLRWLDATLEVAGITTTIVEARAGLLGAARLRRNPARARVLRGQGGRGADDARAGSRSGRYGRGNDRPLTPISFTAHNCETRRRSPPAPADRSCETPVG